MMEVLVARLRRELWRLGLAKESKTELLRLLHLQSTGELGQFVRKQPDEPSHYISGDANTF